MKVTIYSPYDCLVKFDNNETFLNQNEHLVLSDEEKSISIYPTNKNSGYSFFIDLKQTSSPFYTIMKKNEELFIFLLEGIISQNVDIISLTYNNSQSFIEIGKNTIKFTTPKHQKIISLPFIPKKVDCGNFKHINYALIEDKEKFYFIAYNTISNKSKLFQGDNIEVKENGFVVTNEKNNFYKKIVEEYFFDEDGLKAKSKVFSQRDDISQNLLSYNFINAVKLKDFKSALFLLNDNLKERVSENSLKEFFGDISYFYMIDPLTCFAISNGKNKIFTFKLEESKISDISDGE